MPTVQRLVSAANRGVYTLTNGKVGGKIRNAPVGILTTTGRKTGQPRAWPLMYVDDPDGWIVVASNGGAPNHPGWYRNLEADPTATFQVGADTHHVHAEALDGDDRAAAWERLTRIYTGYEKYTAKTDRVFPVVRLRRTAAATST